MFLHFPYVYTSNVNTALTSLEITEHWMQGILVSGVAYYMQVWVIDKSGPVFLAMTTPITLLVTIMLSSFLLGEVTLGSVSFYRSAHCLRVFFNNENAP